PALHRDLRLIALVAAGGAVGTLARHLLATAFEDDGGLPMTTLAINVAGAFLLGVLLEALVRRGADTDGSRRLRLGLGAGVLGGFTTFSALAVELERLLTDGDVALAGAYALASVVFGVAACG